MNYMKRLCESISVVLLPRFHILLLHDTIKVSITEIEDLLDMDYFLHEFDDLDDDDFGEEGFYIF